MGILKNIWNTLFGKQNQREEFGRGGSIEEPVMKVVHNKNEDEIDLEISYLENEVLEPNPEVCDNVQESVNLINSNNIIYNLKTRKLIDYLSETMLGIDKKEAYEKFNISRLDNTVYRLKKKGYIFKTKKINNKFLYFLISKPKKIKL
jgi:hypothetical protein